MMNQQQSNRMYVISTLMGKFLSTEQGAEVNREWMGYLWDYHNATNETDKKVASKGMDEVLNRLFVAAEKVAEELVFPELVKVMAAA